MGDTVDEYKKPLIPLKGDLMESKVDELKKPLISLKGELMEGKVDELKKSLVSLSPKGPKNENNGKRWDRRLRSILNFLLINILVGVSLHIYDVFVTDGFSLRFAEFAISEFVAILVLIIASKMIGANFEIDYKNMDILGVNLYHVLMLLTFILIPIRLNGAYHTDGLISRRFAHFASGAFSFVFVYLRFSEMISDGTWMVLLLPPYIIFMATFEVDVLVCLTVAGCLVFVTIIWYMLMMVYKKIVVKKSDSEYVSPSTQVV